MHHAHAHAPCPCPCHAHAHAHAHAQERQVDALAASRAARATHPRRAAIPAVSLHHPAALATLGFHYPRRSTFFKNELREFLLIGRQEQWDINSMTGSYAGAMGQAQFMPSSYRVYAVDFAGDGKRDLWHNAADAIGSIANYLAEHGWQADELIAAPAKVGNTDLNDLPVARRSRANLKPELSLKAWQNHEVNLSTPISTDNEDYLERHATLIELDGREESEFWLGFNNFYVITRYNISALYAMSVFQLGEDIKTAYQEQT